MSNSPTAKLKYHIFGLFTMFFLAAMPASAAEKPFVGSPITRKQLLTCELVTSKYSHKTYKKGDKTILTIAPKWALCTQKPVEKPAVKPVSIAPVILDRVALAAQEQLAVEASNMLLYGNPLGPLINGMQADQADLKDRVDAMQQQVNQLAQTTPPTPSPTPAPTPTSTQALGGVPTPNPVSTTTQEVQTPKLMIYASRPGSGAIQGINGGTISFQNNDVEAITVNGFDMNVINQNSLKFGDNDKLSIVDTQGNVYFTGVENQLTDFHVPISFTLIPSQGKVFRVNFDVEDGDTFMKGFILKMTSFDISPSDVHVDPSGPLYFSNYN